MCLCSIARRPFSLLKRMCTHAPILSRNLWNYKKKKKKKRKKRKKRGKSAFEGIFRDRMPIVKQGSDVVCVHTRAVDWSDVLMNETRLKATGWTAHTQSRAEHSLSKCQAYSVSKHVRMREGSSVRCVVVRELSEAMIRNFSHQLKNRDHVTKGCTDTPCKYTHTHTHTHAHLHVYKYIYTLWGTCS